jgi:hypothetical protein
VVPRLRLVIERLAEVERALAASSLQSSTGSIGSAGSTGSTGSTGSAAAPAGSAPGHEAMQGDSADAHRPAESATAGGSPTGGAPTGGSPGGDSSTGATHTGDSEGLDAVARLIGEGNQVHRRFPQKRWTRLATGVSYGYVSVFVPDQPGGFADILRALADASVNVEDITVDHVPERPLGLVELTVLAAEVEHATAVLAQAGFSASGRLDEAGE